MVNGKLVAPKLATLEVNLIGVFYSEQKSLSTSRARSSNSHFTSVTAVQPSTLACIMLSATGPLSHGKPSL